MNAHEGRVFKRPGTHNLWIAYYVDGIEYRESSASTDQRTAEALLKHRIAEKVASRAGLIDFIGPQRLTVDALLDGLLDDYRIRGRKSLAKTHSHVQPIRRLLEGALASEIDSAKLRWYTAQRLDEGKTNAKINRELAALRRAFNLARQDGRLRQVPHFPMLPENNIRRGFFEFGEAERLIMFLPGYLQDLVRFAFWTGWRLGEVTGLQWDMID